MAFGTRAEFDVIRQEAFGAITGVFTAIGPPLANHSRIVKFSNSTNEDIYVSDDGVNIKLRVATNSFILFDFSSNKVSDDGLFVAVGTQFYIQYAVAPSSGEFWIEVVSASGGV
jgi:hypothetical protein